MWARSHIRIKAIFWVHKFGLEIWAGNLGDAAWSENRVGGERAGGTRALGMGAIGGMARANDEGRGEVGAISVELEVNGTDNDDDTT